MNGDLEHQQQSPRPSSATNPESSQTALDQQSPPTQTRTIWVVFDVFHNLAHIVLLCVFLALYSDQPCDEHLPIWLGGSLFLYVFHALPQRPLSVWIERHPDQRYHPWVQTIKRLWAFGNVLDLCWFVTGNVWLFKSQTCSNTSPKIYYLTLVELILFWVTAVLPLVVIVLLILIFRRRLLESVDGGGPTGGGLTPLELSRLRTFSFNDIASTAGAAFDAAASVVAPAKPVSAPPEIATEVASEKLGGIGCETLLDNGSSVGSVPCTPAPPEATADVEPPSGLSSASSSRTCSICVEDYLQGDRLRELNCGHRFHKVCVDPWLLPPPLPDGRPGRRGHRTCPLCVCEAVAESDRDPELGKAAKRAREEELRRIAAQVESQVHTGTVEAIAQPSGRAGGDEERDWGAGNRQ
ncbi:hypothetical protein BDK51DRAFT_29342 [Blyttiomyces helicus]|uniref:RING-type domain-containing protein n=1 Tax=Blyttiomyces helicus TaxID=388810 RepID=A0A4P9WKQ2_9FUNG|nr:hypothetical protein BDK51DRAFT_29342 [Blyttiomyces helicus]|eukprot:RKO93394.1 hypothetical protein BDK51DRAFT_29342 [Blyttiomyces helicus]